MATPVKVISDAHGQAETALHRHGLVRLPGGCLVELDAYPPTATARGAVEGDLPPGMAIVSFDIDDIDNLARLAPPATGVRPGANHPAACFRGAVGEMIELIASKPGFS